MNQSISLGEDIEKVLSRRVIWLVITKKMLGLIAQACNPSTRRLKQRVAAVFEVSLGYRARTCLEKLKATSYKQINKNHKQTKTHIALVVGLALGFKGGLNPGKGEVWTKMIDGNFFLR